MAIQKYAESIETEMLNEFDQAYKDGNTATMAVGTSITVVRAKSL